MISRRLTRHTAHHLPRALLLSIALLLLTTPLYAAPSDLDPTWGVDGVVTVDFDGDAEVDSVVLEAVVAPDGKVVVIGLYLGDGPVQVGVSRFQTNGQPDLAFGTNGTLLLSPPLPDYDPTLGLPNSHASYIDFLSDGQLIIGSQISLPGSDTEGSILVIARVSSTGQLDLSFGAAGYLLLSPDLIYTGVDDPEIDDYLIAMQVLADDKIMVSSLEFSPVGASGSGLYLTRIRRDGSVDPTFGTQGVVRLEGIVGNLTVQTDGKLVVVMNTNSMAELFPDCTTVPLYVTRVNMDGSTDVTFGEDGGRKLLPISQENGEPCVGGDDGGYNESWNARILPGGQILFSGYSVQHRGEDSIHAPGFVVQLTPDGDFDADFDENGIIIIDYDDQPANEIYYSSAVQANGKLIFAGDVTQHPERPNISVTRHLPNGEVDVTWGTGGRRLYPSLRDHDSFTRLSPQSDGKLIVSVFNLGTQGEPDNRILRILTDPAFGYTTLSPRHRQPHIAPNANLSLTFAGPVTINAGEIEIRRVSDYALHERIPVTDAARVTGGGTTTITINPNADFATDTRYFVIVHPNSFVNPSGHPFSGVNALTEWHFTTGQSAPVNLLLNRGFEGKGTTAKRAAKWPAKRLVATDGRICNQTPQGTPPKIYAHGGKCAFRFKHNAVRGRSIEQIVTLVDALAGEVLSIDAYVRRNALTTGAQIQVQLTYSDSKTQLVNLPIPRGTQPYRLIARTFTLPKDAVKARVRVMTGKSKGTLLVDDLTLTVGTASALPVDLPAAPDLRGN